MRLSIKPKLNLGSDIPHDQTRYTDWIDLQDCRSYDTDLTNRPWLEDPSTQGLLIDDVYMYASLDGVNNPPVAENLRVSEFAYWRDINVTLPEGAEILKVQFKIKRYYSLSDGNGVVSDEKLFVHIGDFPSATIVPSSIVWPDDAHAEPYVYEVSNIYGWEAINVNQLHIGIKAIIDTNSIGTAFIDGIKARIIYR